VQGVVFTGSVRAQDNRALGAVLNGEALALGTLESIGTIGAGMRHPDPGQRHWVLGIQVVVAHGSGESVNGSVLVEVVLNHAEQRLLAFGDSPAPNNMPAECAGVANVREGAIAEIAVADYGNALRVAVIIERHAVIVQVCDGHKFQVAGRVLGATAIKFELMHGCYLS